MPGGGDNGGGSGGNGGGGGNHNPDPPPPCEEDCDGGWVILLPRGACDTFIDNLQNNATFAANFKLLTEPAVLSLGYEKGYYVNDVAGSNYTPIQGTPNNKIIQLDGSITDPMDGFIHVHTYGLGLAPMFSPGDVLIMARAYLGGHAKDTNNLFFGVAHSSGPPYLIKVTNPNKFRKFAEKIVKSEAETKENKRFSEKYKKSFNSTNTSYNEKEFLEMLRDLWADNGITLYRAENNNCTKWIKLQLDNSPNASPTGVKEVPCN